MALDFHVASETDGIVVRRVLCRPHASDTGEFESNPSWSLTFPLRGVFRKHVGRNSSGIADETRGLFFLPGRPYRVSHFDDRGDECLSFDFKEPVLAGFARETEAIHRRNQEPLSVPLTGEAQRLRSLLAARLAAGSASALEVEERAIRLLELSLAAIDVAPSAPDRSGLRRRRADAVLERFHGEPGHDWRLEDLARSAYSSRRQLTESFRAETGQSIHRYLLQLRLSRALDELLAGHRSVSDIGLDLGFSTPSHFAAAFRGAFGTPPTALRALDLRNLMTAAAPPGSQVRPFSTALSSPRR